MYPLWEVSLRVYAAWLSVWLLWKSFVAFLRILDSLGLFGFQKDSFGKVSLLFSAFLVWAVLLNFNQMSIERLKCSSFRISDSLSLFCFQGDSFGKVSLPFCIFLILLTCLAFRRTPLEKFRCLFAYSWFSWPAWLSACWAVSNSLPSSEQQLAEQQALGLRV